MAGPGAFVLDCLNGAAEAARRARRDPRGTDALHRFRIGVRRLAVNVKAVEKTCGVPPKLRRRLRRVLRATGPRRDRQVSALWLDDFARGSRARADGARALAEKLSRGSAPGPGPREWLAFERTLKRLRRALEKGLLKKAELRRGRRRLVKKEWRRLARRLRQLDRGGGAPALHRARIAVKKLRYLSESMDAFPRGVPAPRDLRRLQRALGEAHDRDVIADAVAAVAGSPGLRAAARRALRQLKREKSSRLSDARRCWKPMLA